jgi:hypothetical protein
MSDKWDAALRALVQEKDGRPLAYLMRGTSLHGEPGPIPPRIVYALADLLDPQISWNQYANRPDRQAVRLQVKPLTKAKRDRVKRHGLILGQMLAEVQDGKSVSDAAQIAGENANPPVSERQVMLILAAARRVQPMLQALVRPKRKIQRRHDR